MSKNLILAVLIFSTVYIQSIPTISPAISIEIMPAWIDLDTDTTNIDVFGNWIHAGTIVIKKKTPEYILLQNLTLTWHGTSLAELEASFYKKPIDKQFLAIEQHILADGIWHPKKQQLSFCFSEPVSLESTTELCLVLTIAHDNLDQIKKGHFTLEHLQLPTRMQELLEQQSLSLAWAP